MKAIALTNKGIEDISADEIKQYAEVTEVKPGIVLFDAEDLKQLLLLCYNLRSVSKIMLLLDNFKFKESPVDSIKKNLSSYNLNTWLNGTFSVVGEREGIHSFNSQELSQQISKLIKASAIHQRTNGRNSDGLPSVINNCGGDRSEHATCSTDRLSTTVIDKKHSAELDLKNPDTIFFFQVVNDEFYFGLDLCGIDLSKRDYRLFLGSDTLKGNIAFALLKLADYTSKKSLLNLFCRAGTIAIEAALLSSRRSPHFYRKENMLITRLVPEWESIIAKEDKKIVEDQFQIIALDDNFGSVQSAKKNAKVAGVLKQINFTKQDVEWLDVKYGKKSFDCIVSAPQNLTNLFFERTHFVLTDKGSLVLYVRKPIQNSLFDKYFGLEQDKIIFQGNEEYHALVFRKINS